VFGYSVGLGRSKQPALEWITCNTGAGPTQTVINSMGEVRLKARDYLGKLSEILALSYRQRRNAAGSGGHQGLGQGWQPPVIWAPAYMVVLMIYLLTCDLYFFKNFCFLQIKIEIKF
jgi:hypothetical protein